MDKKAIRDANITDLFLREVIAITTWLDLGWDVSYREDRPAPDLTGYKAKEKSTGEVYDVESTDEKFIQLVGHEELAVGDRFAYPNDWELLDPEGNEVNVDKRVKEEEEEEDPLLLRTMAKKAQITVEMDSTINAGTSYRGDFGFEGIDYATLVEVFGEPNAEVDEYKTDAQWIGRINGEAFTIYNYKSGRGYLGERGQDVEDIRDWHIGGIKGSEVASLVNTYVTEGGEDKLRERTMA